MEDLIVIILTLIVVVVGAIGQIKRKPQPQTSEETQKPSGGFWDFLEGLNEPIQQPKNQPIYEDEVLPQENTVPQSYTFSAQKEGSPMETKLISENIKEQNTEKKEIKKIVKSFSLKKAVIYSEILNNKYS